VDILFSIESLHSGMYLNFESIVASFTLHWLVLLLSLCNVVITIWVLKISLLVTVVIGYSS